MKYGSICSGIEAATMAWWTLGWEPAEQCPDGPRYRALGNSMAVPVVRWIGERINLFMEVLPCSTHYG